MSWVSALILMGFCVCIMIWCGKSILDNREIRKKEELYNYASNFNRKMEIIEEINKRKNEAETATEKTVTKFFKSEDLLDINGEENKRLYRLIYKSTVKDFHTPGMVSYSVSLMDSGIYSRYDELAYRYGVVVDMIHQAFGEDSITTHRYIEPLNLIVRNAAIIMAKIGNSLISEVEVDYKEDNEFLEKCCRLFKTLSSSVVNWKPNTSREETERTIEEVRQLTEELQFYDLNEY